MRTRIILILSLFFMLNSSVHAQRKEDVEDKVQQVLAQFDNTIKPEKSKRANLETIFTDFYNAQEKLRDNIQGSSSTLSQGLSQDYQSVRKRNENIIADRDAQLKKILSSDEFKKWKEDIEPSIRSTRGKR